MNIRLKIILIFTAGIILSIFATACSTYLITLQSGSLLSFALYLVIFISFEVFIIYIGQKLIYQSVGRFIDAIVDFSKDNTLEVDKYERFLNRNDSISAFCREYCSTHERINTLIREQYQNRINVLFFQMKFLESQVNSHFLNGVLEAINSIAEIEGVESISVLSLALGKMFRYSLRTMGNLVLLKDELNYLKNYIDISEIRFINKFKVYYDIDQSLYNFKMLKLILQPIVENAVYHGLNPCKSHDGIIKIKVYESENEMIIQISDNGIGISEENLSKLRKDISKPMGFEEQNIAVRTRIGLRNIQSRIQLYYGTNYGLLIESKQNIGTTVTIKLPYQGGI